MMSVPGALRAAHQRLIDEAPVPIAIHRTEYTDDGMGGREEQKSDLAPFIGRIVPSRQAVQDRTTEAGQLQTAAWLLLAPWDAYVRAGTDVEDTFIVAGRRFRVRHVMPRRYGAETYALQAALEELS